MSPSATSLAPAAERVPHWSSTGHASARPDSCPTLLPTPHSSQRDIIMGAQARSIGPAGSRNHPTVMPPRLAHTPSAAVKSP